MNNSASLSAAKIMVKEDRFQEAKVVFERITNEKSIDSAEAAYCLGIIHHTGSGVTKNVDEAAKYFLIASQSGHAMATYRLGGIYYRRHELQKAYDSFQSVAQRIPAASYSAYRLLMTEKRLDSDPEASEKYLNSAAEQGHVLAQRTIAMRYVSGKEGLLKIPYGLALFAKAVSNIIRTVIIKNEKVKYE
jgi:TPR repeat protein